MSKGNTFENEWLLHVFNNADIANIGDAGGLRGSVTAGSLYLALHTADPGEAGDQTTNEISYTGYGRQAVARTVGGFTVSGNQVTLASAVTFGQCSAGTGTVTHFSVGTVNSGAGKILYKGPVSPNIAVAAGVTPQLGTGTTITED